MSDRMEALLPRPPGTWRRPSAYPDPPPGPVREYGRPVIRVVLTAPISEPAPVDPMNDPSVVLWEAFSVPPIGGAVDWNRSTYPRGTARLELDPTTARWQRLAGTSPGGPTISPEGVPWAVLPGALAAVYYGWADPAGNVSGVRVFDGMVMACEYARPGRTWVLTCNDFTALMDGVRFHDGRPLNDLTAGPSMPPFDADGNIGIRQAVRFMARESSEYWWPMPAEQLPYDDPDLREGIYAFTFADISDDNDPPDIDGDTDMGGTTAWEWVEAWCDLYGVEAAIVPGGAADVTIAAPPDAYAEPRLAFLPGDGGNLLAWTATYSRIVTRSLFTLETRDAARFDTDYQGTPDPDAEPIIWRVRAIGLAVELWFGIYPEDTCAVHSMMWGDPDEPGGTDEGLDPAQWSGGHGTETADMWRFRHTYPRPGTYRITVDWSSLPGKPPLGGTWAHDVTVTDQPFREYGLRGSPTLDTDHASTVRRIGRIVHAEHRTVPNSFAHLDPLTRAQRADKAAAAMKRRVEGRERARTFQIVPAPWLMPGDVIAADLGDGLATQPHVIEAVTIPLGGDDQGMTVVTHHRDLA